MRLTKSHLVFLLAVASALIVTSATTGATGVETRAKPTVMVSGTTPVTVVGAGFLPRERVTVRISVGAGGASRVARATRRGRFVLEFPSFTLPECVSTVVTVVATGSRSLARARGRTIPPPCGPAPQP